MSAVIFTLVFSIVVYLGIHIVDYLNRALMIVKLGAYLSLVFLLLPFISSDKLAVLAYSHLTSATALTVTITSFGFAIIVPSLRVYFAGEVNTLRKAIFLGSLVPLICYIAWDAAIMGVIPLSGAQGLVSMLHATHSTSVLVHTLTQTVGQQAVTVFAKLFTSICVLTSFLGVSLCLTDFLSDGFSLEKKGRSALMIHAMTFLLP